jgi:hypothetical protein
MLVDLVAELDGLSIKRGVDATSEFEGTDLL